MPKKNISKNKMNNLTSDNFERPQRTKWGAEVRHQNSSRFHEPKKKIKLKKKAPDSKTVSVAFFHGMFHHLTFRLIASLRCGRSGQLCLWKIHSGGVFFCVYLLKNVTAFSENVPLTYVTCWSSVQCKDICDSQQILNLERAKKK